jgi:hypothetical protein
MSDQLTRERYLKLTSATLGWCNARRGDLGAAPLDKLQVHLGDELIDIIDRNFPDVVSELKIIDEGAKLSMKVGEEELVCALPPIAAELVIHVATSYEPAVS